MPLGRRLPDPTRPSRAVRLLAHGYPVSEADMAAQLARVHEMERNGELAMIFREGGSSQ